MMVVLDTHAFVFDALEPKRLSKRVRSRISTAAARYNLVISDISLWEVAMLVERGRLDVGTTTSEFLEVALEARATRVLPITPPIAQRAARMTAPPDPSDRIIASTALEHGAILVTSDRKLQKLRGLRSLW